MILVEKFYRSTNNPFPTFQPVHTSPAASSSRDGGQKVRSAQHLSWKRISSCVQLTQIEKNARSKLLSYLLSEFHLTSVATSVSLNASQASS
mmetsp:Transcript_90/g.334  ORF Transcript_90/g.334 Transcript_90/m.334 type:complete len:92 (-) Transcript_90:648-923(-)